MNKGEKAHNSANAKNYSNLIFEFRLLGAMRCDGNQILSPSPFPILFSFDIFWTFAIRTRQPSVHKQTDITLKTMFRGA